MFKYRICRCRLNVGSTGLCLTDPSLLVRIFVRKNMFVACLVKFPHVSHSGNRKSGPLVGVKGFHPACIRWCLMHVVHLGLLYVCNGSAMIPGSIDIFLGINIYNISILYMSLSYYLNLKVGVNLLHGRPDETHI